MNNARRADVAVNIFAKPYQTSLAVLSLLKCCDRHVDRIFLQFEPYGSMYDKASPYAIAAYLGDRAVVSQPRYWLELNAPDPSRLSDPQYRLSIRYQHAFETTDKDLLFVMHNDVLIKKDIIGAMRDALDGAFVIGQLGQCWNCPARDAQSVALAGLGNTPCSPDRYRDFQPDPAGLSRLYATARGLGLFVRPYDEALREHYGTKAWPLPECRVSEWGCLVDVSQTRDLCFPFGTAPPFGAFEQCGRLCLDTAVAWFRELNRRGLFARHMDISPYLTHWIGTAKMTEYKYARAEGKARGILERNFPGFVSWCREQGNGMF